MFTHQNPEQNSGTFAVDGADLAYVIEGQGQVCIVVGSSIYHPRTFSQELRQHLKMVFVDARIFRPTQPDFNVQEITFETITNDIETIRRILGFDKIIIMGHSIFGVLALEYARRYPLHTSHVVIIGSPPYGLDKLTPITKSFWETDASEERKKVLTDNWSKVTEESLAKLSASDRITIAYITDSPIYWYSPNYDASWLWADVQINADALNHIYGILFREYDFDQVAPEIKTPIFLAQGRYDYVVPYTLWDGLKDKLPNLSYCLFNKSGHTPQLEEPILFVQHLLTWLNEKRD